MEKNMTAGDEQVYKEVISRIIQKQVELLGSLAVLKASTVGGLEIDDQGGVISITGVPFIIIHNLLLKYEEIAGRAATMSSKMVVADLKTKYPGLELPPKLL